jgi:hypothetical protein
MTAKNERHMTAELTLADEENAVINTQLTPKYRDEGRP